MKYHEEANVRDAIPQLVPVRFGFPHATAFAVCIVNSGPEWQSGALVPDFGSHPSFCGRNAILNVARARNLFLKNANK